MQSTIDSCQIVLKVESSRQIFETYSNIKFHKNPSSGSRAVPCGQKEKTKLKLSLRYFANPPKNAITQSRYKVVQI
jgi:hypothetical protein